jgi:DnaK suppressor protein
MDEIKTELNDKQLQAATPVSESVLADPVILYAMENYGAKVAAIHYCSGTIDLHVHTKAFDGTAEPQELVKQAAVQGRKQRLQLEIAGVEAQIRTIDAQCHQRFSYGNDAGDEANDLCERTKGLALRELLEGRLRQLTDTLAHVAADRDGICDICGELIDPARLEARPEATLCVACQRSREQGLYGAKAHRRH